MQIVFQDPYGSLSPRMSVSDIIQEGMRIHMPHIPRHECEKHVIKALEDVGLDPETRLRYPHEFSGGQRQRIAVARAIVLEPTFVVLDEPTSALDMLIQAQMVDLLCALQKRHDLTYMFISHDLRVVAAMSSRLMVMKDGKVVESRSRAANCSSRRRAPTPARCSPPPSISRPRPRAWSRSEREPDGRHRPIAIPRPRSRSTALTERDLGGGKYRYERYRVKRTAAGRSSAMSCASAAVVVVIPVDLDRDEVVHAAPVPAGRASRHRTRASRSSCRPGRSSAAKELIDAARRECLEEIGVAPHVLVPLFGMMPSPGMSDEHMTFFLGVVDAAKCRARRRCARAGGHAAVPRADRPGHRSARDQGGLQYGATVLGLQWLALNRARLAEIARGGQR